MSRSFKRVRLLVSRSYSHGARGVENRGLHFYRSQAEYDQEAKEKGWNLGRSFGSTWCTKPEEIEALVSQKDLAQFEQGNPLPMDRVFFVSTLIPTVQQVGGWQG